MLRRHVHGIFAVALSAAALFASPARSNEAKLVEALSFFNEAALWNAPGAAPATPRSGIMKMAPSPIRAFFQQSSTSSVRTDAIEALGEVAKIAGYALEIVDSADKATMILEFLQDYQRPAGRDSAGCMTRYGPPILVSVRVNQSNCIRHEYMHAFGFPSHPHEFNTVLSYTRQGSTRLKLTDIDELALRTMYGAKLTAGMYHLPALVAARQYMAEELGLVEKGADAGHLARGVLDKALARMRETSVKDYPWVASQLGNAYAFGHYVAVDLTEAHRWWEKAAEMKYSEAIYQIGRAALAGRGIPADPAAARGRFAEASALKNGGAAFELGKMLRDGLGGPTDPVEAYAQFDRAAKRNVRDAAGARAAVEATLNDEQRARAKARIAELDS